MEDAKAIISVDHSFKCYINGQLVSQGEDWRRVNRFSMKSVLKPGQNIIGIEAQIWSETIKGQEMVEYYYLPKLIGFAVSLLLYITKHCFFVWTKPGSMLSGFFLMLSPGLNINLQATGLK